MSFYGGNDTDPEGYSICPYDPKHLILNKRMAGHLMKCARNFVCSEMETCPYNAKHVYPRVQHQHHITHCIDRALIDREILYGQETASTNNSGDCSLPSYDGHNYEVEENWDDDSGRTYFNAKYIENSAVRLPANEPILLKTDEKSEVEKKLEERRKVRMVNTIGAFLQSNGADDGGSFKTNEVVRGSDAIGTNDCADSNSPVRPVVAVGYGRGIPAQPQRATPMEPLAFGRGRALNQPQQPRKVTTTPAFKLPGVGRGISSFVGGIHP